MKKQFSAVLLVFAVLLTMAGCSIGNAAQRMDAAEDRLEAKLDAAGDTLENSLRSAVRPAPTAAPTETLPAATPGTGMLTKEQAQKIALDHVGLTADQVTRMHTEYEIDDGIPQFDVEFHQGDWEHEFEIHAETGKILSYDKDPKYD